MSQLGESIDQNKVINFLNKIFLSFSASATILCQITTNYNTALRQLYVQIPHQSFFFQIEFNRKSTPLDASSKIPSISHFIK